MTTPRVWILFVLLVPFTADADDRTPLSDAELIEFPSAASVVAQQQARKAADVLLAKFQTRRVSPKFDNLPLDQMVKQLAELTQTTIQIDATALLEEGIGLDTPITFAVRKPQRVIDVLGRMLQPLQLTWIIDDDVVRVTTVVKHKEFLELRAYRVSRLLRLAAEREVRLPEVPRTVELVDGHLANLPAANTENMAAASLVLSNALQEATSGPWSNRDGEGGVAPRVVSGRMLVQQTQQVHREINALLRTAEVVLARPFGSAPLLAVETDEELTELTRLQRVLETEIDCDFTDQPLTDVVKWLSETLDDEIVLDTESLAEEGIAADSAVTFQGRMTARAALQRILEPLQLTQIFRHGAVFITSLPKSKELRQTVVYDVADILLVGHSMQALMRLIEDSTVGPWINTDGEGGTQTEFPGGLLVILQVPSVQDEIALLLTGLRKTLRATAQSPRTKASEFQTRFLQARTTTEAQSIERLLRTFVAPAAWDTTGTGGLIGTAADRIVIRQTKAIHEQIDRFLREYQQATPAGQTLK